MGMIAGVVLTLVLFAFIFCQSEIRSSRQIRHGWTICESAKTSSMESAGFELRVPGWEVSRTGIMPSRGLGWKKG